MAKESPKKADIPRMYHETRFLWEYASDAISILNVKGNLMDVNRKGEILTGYTREELINMNFIQLLPPEEGEEIAAAFREDIQKGSGFIRDISILRKDKKKVPVNITGNVIECLGKRIVQMILRDITEYKQVVQRLNVQYVSTRALAESDTLGNAVLKIMQAVCEYLTWDLGKLWILNRKDNVLRCIEIWHKPSANVQEFTTVGREMVFTYGIGLPGRIWAGKRPSWIEDVTSDKNFPRAPFAAKEGLHGAFGFPILIEDEVLGVIEFFSHEIQPPDDDLLKMFDAIGSQIGQFIERKRAEELLKRRIEFEKTVANVSKRFVVLSDFDNSVFLSLADIGKLSGASRSYVFQLRDNGKVMDNTYEWCSDGVPPEIQNLQNLPTSIAPWWMANLHAGNVIHITDVSKLPPEASSEREILEKQDIKSLVALPVYAEKELVGFIGFDNIVSIGTWREEDISLLRITAEIIGNAIVRRQAEALINHMAYHDSLTNLPNRILFQDRLKMAVSHAKRNGHIVAVLLFDMDNFKIVNDSLGHDTGDLVLKAFSERLKESMRECDTIARLGGDEFIAILSGLTHGESIATVAQKVLSALNKPYQIECHEIRIAASIGISMYPLDTNEINKLLKYADIAMYYAKRHGKNRYWFYRNNRHL